MKVDLANLPDLDRKEEPVETCHYCGKPIHSGDAHGLDAEWHAFAICKECMHR